MIAVYLLLAIVLIYLAINVIYDHFWEHSLNVSIHLAQDSVYEGEHADLKEVIVNDKYLPLPILEISFDLHKDLRFATVGNSTVSDKLYRRDVFYVGMKRRITRTLPLHCIKRGYYGMDKLGIMSYDIFMRKKYLSSRSFYDDLYVYPAKVDSDMVEIPYQKISGELLSRRKLLDDPFEFASIREYALGDPIKNINWKATARSTDVMVNVFSSTVSQNLTIVLDTYGNSYTEAEELNEEAIRIATALAERFFEEGVTLSFVCNAHDLFSGERLSLTDLHNLDIDDLRKQFARLVVGDEQEIQTYFDTIDSDSLLIVISKNTTISESLQSLQNDIVWILPHKFQPPEVPQDKYSVLYWNYNAHHNSTGGIV